MCNETILSHSRNKMFWDKLKVLIDEFPEILDGLDNAYEDLDHIAPFTSEYYDSEAPKLLSGVVLIVQPRNIQGYESVGVLYPNEQSRFLTEGLITHVDRL